MKIRHDSRVVRWAYWPWTCKPWQGDRISLCRLFWQTLWSTFLATLIVTILLGIVATITYEVYLEPWEFLCLTLIVAAIISAVIGTIWSMEKVKESDALPIQLVRAFKHKFCPLIDVE